MTNIITSKTRGYTGSRASPQGKGSKQRPREVSKSTYDENYERTFGHAGPRDKRKGKTKKRRLENPESLS